MNEIKDFKEVERRFSMWSHRYSIQSIEMNKMNTRLKRLEKLFEAIQEAVNVDGEEKGGN